MKRILTSLTLFGKTTSIILATSFILLLIGCRHDPASTPPTPAKCAAVSNLTADTLGQWLRDKEIVSVTFSGPYMEIDWDNRTIEDNKLRNWLIARGDFVNDMNNNSSFHCHSGRRYGSEAKTDKAQVWVTMQTTSNNVMRLLSLQADLQSLDINLDAAETQVISYIGDVETRRKAREMIPDLLDSLVQILNQTSGNWTIDSQYDKYQNSLFYVQELDNGGHISIKEITLTSDWPMYNRPFDVELTLPYLGLQVDGFINHEHDFTLETIERILLQPLIEMDDEPRLGFWYLHREIQN